MADFRLPAPLSRSGRLKSPGVWLLLIVIAGGRIVADETPEALIHRSRYHNAVSVRVAHSADLAAVTSSLRVLGSYPRGAGG